MARTPTPHRRYGFTLLEALIALAIFGAVLVFAFGGIISGLQNQSDQEAVVSAQAKLRRVLEVFTQDLRNAVFGAIIESPYPSGATSISFALLEPDLRYSAVDNRAAVTTVLAAASPAVAAGDRLLLIGSSGQASYFAAAGAPSSVGSGRWDVSHSSCVSPVPVSSSSQALLFVTRPLGFRYDDASDILYLQDDSGIEQPLAFDITAFAIDYVYVDPTAPGVPVVNPAGAPAPTLTIAGRQHQLARLQITLATQEVSRGRPIQRTFTGQVELPSNQSFRIASVQAC